MTKAGPLAGSSGPGSSPSPVAASLLKLPIRAVTALNSGAVSLNMPGGGSLHPATAETVAAKMHFVHQDGQAVYKFAVRKMAEAAETILKRNGVTGADLGCFIPHQANKRIILSTAERLGMPESAVIINIDRFGNTTAATIPMAMQTALEEGRLKKGDLVLLASVGAGFTIGATLLQWES